LEPQIIRTLFSTRNPCTIRIFSSPRVYSTVEPTKYQWSNLAQTSLPSNVVASTSLKVQEFWVYPLRIKQEANQ